MYNAELKEKECFKTVLTNFEKGYLSKTVNGKVLDINDAIFAKPKKLVLCGESIQNGTPAPDAPTEIESISGKNVWDSTLAQGALAFANGHYIIANTYAYNTNKIAVEEGKTYELSADGYISDDDSGFVFFNDEVFISSLKTSSMQVTIPAGVNQLVYDFHNIDGLDIAQISNIKLLEIGYINVKSTGKNLFHGEIVSLDNDYNATSDYIEVLPNTQYIFSSKDNNVTFIGNLWFYTRDKISMSQIFTFNTFTTPANCYFVIITASTKANLPLGAKIQLEKGTVATEYEEYRESIVTIPLLHDLRSLPNGTRDRIYKQNGKWYDEKKVGIVEYDGTEEWTWYEYYSCFYRNENGEGNSKVNMKAPANDDITNLLCNRYKGDTRNNLSANIINNIIANNMCNTHGQVCIRDTRFNNVANFKSELANNNLEVQYELSEPIITEITDEATIQALNQFELLSGVNYITSDAVINLEYFGGTPFEHQKLEAKLYD